MKVIRIIKDMRLLCGALRYRHKTIGFVPTMGALHEGHLSLVRRSKNENDVTVVSIFVNPTQFAPNEDYKQYPRNAKRDLAKLSALSADAVFSPTAHEMYPEGFQTVIHVGAIGEILCGASRPGHFNGVASVVAKLFHIVKPDRAYFGQKDFQQTVVINKMVRDLDFDIEIVVCPTVRERDGLAMSSRNSYLNQEERKAATILFRALQKGKTLIDSRKGNASSVKREIEAFIKSEPLARIEYIEIVEPKNLQGIERIRKPLAICLAVSIGKTRLIDNMLFE